VSSWEEQLRSLRSQVNAGTDAEICVAHSLNLHCLSYSNMFTGAAVSMLHRQDSGASESRRALLKSSVFAVGTLAASTANAAVLTPVPRLISSPSTLPNRTPSEMQYEMFKNGMLLEDDEDYAAACIQVMYHMYAHLYIYDNIYTYTYNICIYKCVCIHALHEVILIQVHCSSC
jgi:hypothetical protein